MKKILFLLTFLFAFAVGAQAQTNCVELREIDGTPDVKCVKIIKVTNGTLACTGNTCTITISGGGGGITIGTTTITSGTTGRVLYDNAGVVGEMTTSGTGTQLALTAGPTFTGTVAAAAITASSTITQTSNSATAFESGPNGGTNPVFRLVNSTASAANGISITGNAAGTSPIINVISSGATEGLVIDVKGTPASANQIATNAQEVNFDRSSTGSANFTKILHRGNFFVGGNGSATNVRSSLILDGGDGSNTPIIRKVTTASIAFGAADAASPVAQTLSVQNVVAGTSDTAGANWTRAGSRGTGTGTGGSHIWQVAPAGSTGSSQNALVNALVLDATPVLTFTRTAIGTTSADGIVLTNSTAATVGAQQYSPRLRLTGQGWKTNATAASQDVSWIQEVQPVQAAANPTSMLVLSSAVNGGAYTRQFAFDNSTASRLYGNNSTTWLELNSATLAGFCYSTNTCVNAGAAFYITQSPNTPFQVYQNNAIINASGAFAATNSSSSAAGTIDVYLSRAGAANWRLGQADLNGAPVAQTLSVQNAVTGTNLAAATTIIRGSLGTSQGTPGILDLQTGGLIAASGTTQQTGVSRATFGASKVLTDNTLTTLVNVTDASNTVASGIVDYAIEVFDGTDLQMETGSFIYQVANKGGAFSLNTITSPTGFPKNAATSGTLTVTWGITGANPALLQVTVDSSLTPSTGYPRITYSIRNLTQQAIAVQ